MAFQPGQLTQHLNAALRCRQRQLGQAVGRIPGIGPHDDVVPPVAVEVFADVQAVGIGPHGLADIAAGQTCLGDTGVIRNHAQLRLGQLQAGARLYRYAWHRLRECSHAGLGGGQQLLQIRAVDIDIDLPIATAREVQQRPHGDEAADIRQIAGDLAAQHVHQRIGILGVGRVDRHAAPATPGGQVVVSDLRGLFAVHVGLKAIDNRRPQICLQGVLGGAGRYREINPGIVRAGARQIVGRRQQAPGQRAGSQRQGNDPSGPQGGAVGQPQHPCGQAIPDSAQRVLRIDPPQPFRAGGRQHGECGHQRHNHRD